MSEETLPTNPSSKENESKFLSIALKFIKKIGGLVLGKTPPPLYLKVLSWIFIFWSLIMIVGFMFMSLTFKIGNTLTGTQSIVDSLTPKYFFTYSLVHLVALTGAILMYRRKIVGFYIFSVATILMPFWELVIRHQFKMSWLVLVMSIGSIGLYAIHFYLLAPKKKTTESQNPEDQG